MVQRVTLKEQVYTHLKKAIINEELKNGEIYSEQSIASELNISRTPVREAILQLQQEKMIDIYPSRGFMVKPMSLEECKKILQLRVAIEGFSAMHMARNIHRQDAQELLTQLEEYLHFEESMLNNPEKSYDFMDSDVQFHLHIISYTNNEYFVSTIDTLRSRMERVINKTLQVRGRMGHGLSEHQAIFECIRHGDEYGAFLALRKHMDNTEELISKMNFS
ncbi:MAG TPA: GntR family transcriptional regulator [Patescibacteria group bacterium]|nr:GntR family transcriptional regulator [Patescibacteria group bacterium]